MARVRLLVIRLLAIASSVGGPLYVYDLLKASPKDLRMFAICFAPIAMMVLGSLAFGDPPSDRLARLAVRVGLFGAIALVLIDAYTVWSVARGGTHPNLLMILVGTAIGGVTSVLYVLLARAFLTRPRYGDL